MDKRTTIEVDGEVPGLVRSAWGRRVLSVFLLVTLAAVFVSVMPDSTIRSGLITLARPYLLATGLDQRWGVFAPNPRQETSFVLAQVEHADGTVEVRPIPTDAGLSEYWNYRWRKYGEQLWTAEDSAAERATFARWIVDEDLAAGGRPVRVILLRHTRDSLPPGPGPDYGPWHDVAFYSSAVDR